MSFRVVIIYHNNMLDGPHEASKNVKREEIMIYMQIIFQIPYRRSLTLNLIKILCYKSYPMNGDIS